MKNILKAALLITCYFFIIPVFAQTTSSQELVDSLTNDLPEADISCVTGGSLKKIFSKLTTFKSQGNVFFIDKVSREIAIFEKAVIDNPNNNPDERMIAKVFIKIPNVSKENIIGLLLRKRLIISQDAKVIFVIKDIKNNIQETYLYESIEGQKNTAATVFSQVKKLKNIVFNDDKFFSAEGTVKIRFPNPPKKIDSSGKLIDVFGNGPGTLLCRCTNCPVHDFDLTDLKDAFDGGLVSDVTSEATKLRIIRD